MRKIGALVMLAAMGCVEVMDFQWAAQGTTVTGGTGGNGGSGGQGGAPFCSPGEKRECYTGPEETKGQGICKAGEQTCNAEGTAYGPCEGQTLPLPAEDCATLEDDNCDGQSSDCVGLHLWSKAFGDSFVQVATGTAMDAAGDVFITGLFYGSVNFGGGALTAAGGGIVQGSDVFLAKFDPDGQHKFSKSFGDSLSQAARGMAVDTSGDIVLVGWFLGDIDLGGGPLPAADDSPDIFVAKLDGTAGAHLWSKSLKMSSSPNAAQPEGLSVALDSAGDVLITGAFSGSLDFGAGSLVSSGGTAAYLVKLEGSSGAALWGKAFGGELEQAATSVLAHANGEITLLGTYTGSMDLGGEAIESNGSTDVFVVRLDGAGAHLWSTTLGSSVSEEARAAATDSADNVIIAGVRHVSANDKDVFVAKLDAGGTEAWTMEWGDSESQDVTTVATDAADNIVVGGTFMGAIDFGANKQVKNYGGADMYLDKLAPDGDCLWSRRFGDDQQDDQLGISIAVDQHGNACVTGSFVGAMDVGPTILMSAGLYDILLMKLSP